MAVQVTGERFAILAPRLTPETQHFFPEMVEGFEATYDHPPTSDEYSAARATFDLMRTVPKRTDEAGPDLLVARQQEHTRTIFGRFHLSSWHTVEILPIPTEVTQPQA